MLTRRHMLGAALGTGAAALSTPAAAFASTGAARLLTATDVHVKDYPTVAAVRWIGEQLLLQTHGELGIKLYHAGQLGRESEAIDMARFGAIDITRVHSGALNNSFPLTQALCLPYLFESVDHLRRAMDGDVGEAVLQGFAKRDLVGLAIYDSGARCFYNTWHPVVTPADLRGLKIRVPVSDIFIHMLRGFGANATPLALGEVFPGMETHMMDGAENNIRSFHSSRHFEAARYWSQSNHSYAPDVLLVSRRSLAALAPRERELLVDLARQSVQVMRGLWDASEQAARHAVQEAGVQFNDVDTAAFRTASQPLLTQFRRDPQIDALCRRIRELA